jgi:outer membrane protein assembly factor BamB
MGLIGVLWTLLVQGAAVGEAAGPASAQTAGPATAEALWDAARQGEVARIGALLDQGADVNAKTRYGVTPLIFAADNGHLEAVKLLVSRGAEIDAQDAFYRMRALDLALYNGHTPVALFLLDKGSRGGPQALSAGIRSGDVALVKAVLAAPGLDAAALPAAAAQAAKGGSAEIAALVRRHTKATQANSTPATDGKHVVTLFGSIGLLVAYDVGGKELWRGDVGTLDSGWFFDPTYQWGHSSSPIIHRDLVIVQADPHRDSYLAAWEVKTGRLRWRTAREGEVSTWGTPTVYRGAEGEVVVTNGTKVRGYDVASGALRWTLGPNSEVTVATPVAGDGLVYVTGGYPPVRPVYAIRPSARGDISLPPGQESSSAIAWSSSREGTYIPTPIVYGDHLFTCGNNGVLTVYRAKTGERVHRGRVGNGGAFTASPVAADGKLYLANEDGEVYVVRAVPPFDELAKVEMKEVIMATPAISDGLIVLRTLGHVYGIGEAP